MLASGEKSDDENPICFRAHPLKGASKISRLLESESEVIFDIVIIFIIESDDENYEIDDAPFSIIRLFPKLHVLMFIRFVVRQMH